MGRLGGDDGVTPGEERINFLLPPGLKQTTGSWVGPGTDISDGEHIDLDDIPISK